MPNNSIDNITVKILLDNQPGVHLPVRGTPGSSGYDICSSEHVLLSPGSYAMVPTGLHIEMPFGYEAQIRPRSGLAAKYGITVLNAPGTIDSDYRGEICVLLINHGSYDFTVEPGMRIAQMVFARVATAEFERSPNLKTSKRGKGGFGSTGTKKPTKS